MVCVCVSACSVTSNSLWVHGLYPPGSSVYGVFQARILEWFVFSSPGDLPDPGTELASPTSPAGGIFTTEPPGKSLVICVKVIKSPTEVYWAHLMCQELANNNQWEQVFVSNEVKF